MFLLIGLNHQLSYLTIAHVVVLKYLGLLSFPQNINTDNVCNVAQILPHMHFLGFMVWIIVIQFSFWIKGVILYILLLACVKILLVFFIYVISKYLYSACKYMYSACLRPSRSWGALRSSNHPHLPQRAVLGGAPERGFTRAVWCGDFNHAHPTDTAITRRHCLP